MAWDDEARGREAEVEDVREQLARVTMERMKARNERDEWKQASAANAEAMTGYQQRAIVMEAERDQCRKRAEAEYQLANRLAGQLELAEAERDRLQVLLTQAEDQSADNYREWGLCQHALTAAEAERDAARGEVATLAATCDAQDMALTDLQRDLEAYRGARAECERQYQQMLQEALDQVHRAERAEDACELADGQRITAEREVDGLRARIHGLEATVAQWRGLAGEVTAERDRLEKLWEDVTIYSVQVEGALRGYFDRCQQGHQREPEHIDPTGLACPCCRRARAALSGEGADEMPGWEPTNCADCGGSGVLIVAIDAVRSKSIPCPKCQPQGSGSCPSCHGSGRVLINHGIESAPEYGPCPTCHGGSGAKEAVVEAAVADSGIDPYVEFARRYGKHALEDALRTINELMRQQAAYLKERGE